MSEDKTETTVSNPIEPVVMKKHTVAKVGDTVLYDGEEGIVHSLDHVFNGTPMYNLVHVDDEELTCSAVESKCTLVHKAVSS